jgi:protease I
MREESFVYRQAMEAVGHTIHVVCPDKNAGDLIETSLHDFEGDQTYTEKIGHYVLINMTFSYAEKQLDQYNAVYCAGGGGPEYIRTDRRVQAIVRHLHETKKPLFTICHGVQILVAVDGVVRGKKVGALAACKPEATPAGGTYIDLSPTEAYVDGTMVSAKGWTALAAFIRECLKVLGTESGTPEFFGTQDGIWSGRAFVPHRAHNSGRDFC